LAATKRRPAHVFVRPAQGEAVLRVFFIVLRKGEAVLRNLLAVLRRFLPVLRLTFPKIP